MSHFLNMNLEVGNWVWRDGRRVEAVAREMSRMASWVENWAKCWIRARPMPDAPPMCKLLI